jgi:hypothetical protein
MPYEEVDSTQLRVKQIRHTSVIPGGEPTQTLLSTHNATRQDQRGNDQLAPLLRALGLPDHIHLSGSDP